MQTHDADQLDTALLDWNERDRAYQAWRDEFYPIVADPIDRSARSRPEASVDTAQRGLKLHEDAVAAQRAYLELRRRVESVGAVEA
ncbi:MAG: hypothetical protein V7637_4440 [Mycobacteriales bacterium]|jgi:hypothetical protein